MPGRPYLSKKSVALIEAAVERLFDSIKLRVLGPGYVESKLPRRIVIGYKPLETLPGLFMYSATEEGAKPTTSIAHALARTAAGYLDAQKHVTKAKVVNAVTSFLQDARSKGVKTDVKTVLGGELADVFASAHRMVTRIVDTEATKARNVGTLDAITKIATQLGMEEPLVYFVVVRDQHLCSECRRLHLMPDGKTPRVWKMSEVGSNYHTVGDANPKQGGLHPHCRCTMASLSPGWGFDKAGMLKFVGKNHDEYSKQRKLEKAEQAAPQVADDLGLAEVHENGVHFKTGQPTAFKYQRRTEKAPKPIKGRPDQFQQLIEPHGRYMSHHSGVEQPFLESGQVHFKNPLVLHFNTGGEHAYDDNSWKARLSRKFNAKGAALSRKLAAAGHDGVITVASSPHVGPYVSEVVDLTSFHPPAPGRR